jgi:hypothetical protein
MWDPDDPDRLSPAAGCALVLVAIVLGLVLVTVFAVVLRACT